MGMITQLTETMTTELSMVLLDNRMLEAYLPEIIPLFSYVPISAGTIILSPEQHWNELLVVRHGIFRLYYLDSEGKESNKGFFSEGQILAPTARSAIEKPSMFFIEALTNVQVYRCRYDQFASVLNGYSNPSRNQFFSRLTEELLENKIRREVMFLQLDARGRYENFVSDFPALHERVPLRHIASYLGMTDVTLSRIRKTKN